MGLHVFKLPDIGEGIAESEIANWHVKVGDVVKEEQALVDMLTDKAAVELPSPVAGRIVELKGNPGDKIPVGGALAVIETDASAKNDAPQPSPLPAGEGAKPSAVVSPSGRGRREAAGEGASPDHRPLASPATRRRAREAGVDLAQVSGSGPGGRVTREDLEAFSAHGAPASSVAARADAGLARRDAVEEIKIIGLRRKIAEAMQRSKQRIPHFAYVEEVDVTELEALRQQLNTLHGAARGKLTLLPFLMRALVKVRAQFPQVNGTYDDEAGIAYRHSAVHAGVATQTPSGLLVPVVRHAETLDLWQAAAEIKRLSEAARSGKAKREELSGSTITITSLGALGGIVSTPVINAPEVAIVGVNKMVERPVVRNGQIAVRLMMNLSSSFDHRIVDGADAAAFIQAIKALLEHPATLFIE